MALLWQLKLWSKQIFLLTMDMDILIHVILNKTHVQSILNLDKISYRFSIVYYMSYIYIFLYILLWGYTFISSNLPTSPPVALHSVPSPVPSPRRRNPRGQGNRWDSPGRAAVHGHLPGRAPSTRSHRCSWWWRHAPARPATLRTVNAWTQMTEVECTHGKLYHTVPV